MIDLHFAADSLGLFSLKFLPRDASAERGYEIAFVCPSVCDVQVSGTHRLEFFENNFTAE